MRRDIRHVKTPRFRRHYDNLPIDIKRLANKSFELLKQDPRHPSLAFKKVNTYWSVRVGINYRTLAYENDNTYFWFWIGRHDEYMRLIAS